MGDGRATELINYEASLVPKIKDGNVRRFIRYHSENYGTLKDGPEERAYSKGKEAA
ncbi:MAG: hypothetical protein ACJ70Q_04120 [Nitrososphaera sp.]